MAIENYLNHKFGRLLVIDLKFINKHNRKVFNCLCDCGNEICVTDVNLRHSTKSCGCLRREMTSKRFSKTKEEIEARKERYKPIGAAKEKERLKNPEAVKRKTEVGKLWRQKNKEKLNEQHRYKMKNDILYHLKWAIRNRFKQALIRKYKKGLAIDNLGCSIEELKFYLEKKFQENMCWENYGQHGWHIDHIMPLSLFNLLDENEVAKACHYTNLQPLWAKDNLSKGNKLL